MEIYYKNQSMFMMDFKLLERRASFPIPRVLQTADREQQLELVKPGESVRQPVQQLGYRLGWSRWRRVF